MSAWTCAKTCALSEIHSLFQIQIRPKARYDLAMLNGIQTCTYLVDFFARIEKYCLTAEKTVDKLLGWFQNFKVYAKVCLRFQNALSH